MREGQRQQTWEEGWKESLESAREGDFVGAQSSKLKCPDPGTALPRGDRTSAILG